MKAITIIFIFASLFCRAQTNSIVTENYLRLNFTPKSGITPGTNDFIGMDCDQITVRYYVTISGISSTGVRLPSQNQLTYFCPSIGDPYGGGKVAYLFVSGDVGCITGECHGIVAQTYDIIGTYMWGCGGTLLGASYIAVGYGLTNTQTIVYNCSNTNISAYQCYNLSDIDYTWFLPSREELLILYQNRSLIGNFYTSGDWYYSSSSEYSSDENWNVNFTNGVAYTGTNSKGIPCKVRAIRYF